MHICIKVAPSVLKKFNPRVSHALHNGLRIDVLAAEDAKTIASHVYAAVYVDFLRLRPLHNERCSTNFRYA